MMKKKDIKPIDFPDTYSVIAADLSLKRPGFCVLSVNKEFGQTQIEIKELTSVDNKNNKTKCHGELLNDINSLFINAVFPYQGTLFFVRETEVMNLKIPSERNVSKVVGLMDFVVWRLASAEWNSIYPVTIKKLIAGSGKATKEEVAASLEKYVGKQNYKCDDESDAVAVGIAWLIQQGELKEIDNDVA